VNRITVLIITLVLFHTGSRNCYSQTRPFLMGFSPWPYAATIEAVNWVYDKIASEGDIISHHIEQGVPWPEAYSGQPFPQSFMAEIQDRKNKLVPGQKVVLQISPLNIMRDGMALYRGEQESMPLPAPWDSYSLNSTEVKTAFLNYADRMVEYLNPDYLLIGIEVNLLIRNNKSLWEGYTELHRYVNTELKKKYPNLPVSVSVFCVPYFPEWSGEDTLADQMSGLNDLLPSVDFLSYSIHPFMCALLAEQFPDNYLQRLFDLSTKPIAIAESSYPAQVWQTMSEPILTFNGSQEKQDNFLTFMLEESERYDTKFVVWFSIRDYDTLWVNSMNQSEIGLIWRDTGLFDELGNERLAMATWKEWFAKEYVDIVYNPKGAVQSGAPFLFMKRVTNSEVVITFPGSLPVTDLSVYNSSGRMIYHYNGNGGNVHTISTYGLGPGVYLFNVICGGEFYSVKDVFVK